LVCAPVCVPVTTTPSAMLNCASMAVCANDTSAVIACALHVRVCAHAHVTTDARVFLLYIAHDGHTFGTAQTAPVAHERAGTRLQYTCTHICSPAA
jgi:hypothetical protein